MTRVERARQMGALDRLARRQHGLVTTAQLERLGFDRDARKYLSGTGRIIRVRRGVYRLCGVSPTWRSTALAAVLAASASAAAPADRGAVLSHHAAAALWGLIDDRSLRGPLQITSPAQARLAGVQAHRHRLHHGDRAARHNVPVTSVERTLVDLAETEPASVVGRLLDDAIRRRLTNLRRLVRCVAALRASGRRRLAVIRRVLADRGAGYDPGANVWEQRMDRLWDELGLPPAERQYTVVLPGGRKYRPDRVIVAERITIDWNGYGTHGLRSGFEHDIERRNRLIAAGWTPLEFHSNQSPERICETVLQVYARQRATSLPAS